MPPQRRWLECRPCRRTEDGFHAGSNPRIVEALYRAKPLARLGLAVTRHRQFFAGRGFVGTPRSRRLLFEWVNPRPDREETTKDAARSLSRTDGRNPNQLGGLNTGIGQTAPELSIHTQQACRRERNWSLSVWHYCQAMGAMAGATARKLLHPLDPPHQASSLVLGSRTPRSARTDVGDFGEVAGTQIGRCDVRISGHYTTPRHRSHPALSYGEKRCEEALANSDALTEWVSWFKLRSAARAISTAIVVGMMSGVAIGFAHAEDLKLAGPKNAAVVTILDDFRTCISEAAAVTTPEIVPDKNVRKIAFETIVESCKGSRDAKLRGAAADARAEDITNSIINGAKAEIGLGS